MERLIITGDPGVRKGAVIEVDGEELVCFTVTRNGDYHGPEEVQLWCVAGEEDETEAFERREFIPHALDVTALDADDLTVVSEKGELAV
ncbi:MAG: HAH_0734 family protein [Halobacteriales archaeon]